jgi:hypothetical protein
MTDDVNATETYKNSPIISNTWIEMDACNSGSALDGSRMEPLPEYTIPFLTPVVIQQ